MEALKDVWAGLCTLVFCVMLLLALGMVLTAAVCAAPFALVALVIWLIAGRPSLDIKIDNTPAVKEDKENA